MGEGGRENVVCDTVSEAEVCVPPATCALTSLLVFAYDSFVSESHWSHRPAGPSYHDVNIVANRYLFFQFIFSQSEDLLDFSLW